MKKAVEKIHFHYLTPAFYFPHRNKLKHFLFKQVKQEGKEVNSINYIFCSDQHLLKMNQDYLAHDTLTDIITFELSGEGESLLADVYISVERVRDNAASFKQPFLTELHRVIFHGLLHLVGYRDKTKKDVVEMRRKEDEYLKCYFVSRKTVSV